jgi:hypothetical protein
MILSSTVQIQLPLAMGEKIAKRVYAIKKMVFSFSPVVVEESAYAPKFEGSNPAPAGHSKRK